jgi:flagellar hook-associated protein 2
MTTSSASSSSLSSLLASLGGSSATSTSTGGSLITAGQIDVTTLVNQMMSVESQPLVRLQAQEAGVQSRLSAYGKIQSALSSLAAAASGLTLPSAFKAAAASVSGGSTSATVSGQPASGTYAVTVSALAQAQSVASAPQSSATVPLATGSLTLQVATPPGGAAPAPITVNVSAANNTLAGLAAAINSAAGGSVNASVISDSSGSRLVLASANTGASNAFTVAASAGLGQFAYSASDPTGVAGGMAQTQAAGDASFSVNGLALKSSSNVITSAISGLTLTLNQAPAVGAAPLQSQVTVATDPTAVTASVNSFVTAYNAVISQVNTLTNYDANSNTASVLTGDFSARSVVANLQSIIGGKTTAPGTGATTAWLAQIGLKTNSDGTLSLNAPAFQAAFSANPAAVAAMFTTATGSGSQLGFAVQMENTVNLLVGSTGVLGSAEQSLQSQVTYMNNQQTFMQAQLAQTQARLTQEYSSLNATVTNAQAQQVSLANALAALPG